MKIFIPLIFCIFLVLVPMVALAGDEQGLYVIPLIIGEDFFQNNDIHEGDEIWFEIEYSGCPDCKVIHQEVAEKLLWIHGQPVILLGATGIQLPGKILDRNSVYVEVFWKSVRVQNSIFFLEPRKNKVFLNSFNITEQRPFNKSSSSIDAAYLALVANYLVNNVSSIDVIADSYSIELYGAVINSSGEWVGEPVNPNLSGGDLQLLPGNPTHAGAIFDDGTTELYGPRRITVSGKYAYVASANDDGVEILDVSDPSNPIHVGAITDDGTTALDGPYDIYVSGKYAYVVSYYDDGVEILDVSDPTNPTHVGAIFDDGTTALNGANGIYVSGKYAYVASFTDDGVEILDVSDPSNPTHVGAIFDDGTTALDGAHDITISGKYAYVASHDDDGVEILDVSDPSNPTHVGAITDDGTTALAAPYDIYVSGKYAYVASFTDDGVEILDVSDPSNPTHVGAIFDDGTTALDGALGIYVSGKYAYVTSEYDDGVEILDVSDPANPTHVGAIFDDGATALDIAYGITVSGNYAYVAGYGDNGVEILDISGIDAPSASIGAMEAGTLMVNDNLQVGNNAHIHNGLNVGPGGIYSQGELAVGGDTFIDGDLTITGSCTGCSSDLALKQDLLPLDHALDKILHLSGYTFHWSAQAERETSAFPGRQIGIIAQEVEPYFPELVGIDSRGYKFIRYQKLVVPLIEAIKELRQENDVIRQEFRKENDAIRKENYEMRKRIEALETPD